jgi:outer membrane lipoprotein-sorting protein
MQNCNPHLSRPRWHARWLALGVLVTLATASAAQPPSAEEIVQRQLGTYYQAGKDFQAKVVMRLTNAQGSQRERTMTMLRVNTGTAGGQRYLITFEAPADVRGMGFLVWKYAKREDDRWLYFPALKAVKRVAADDKRSSFVGSDFSYEDISGRDEEQHTLVRQESLEDRPVFVVESKPKGAATYARRLSWIDRERWLPLKEEYFDAEGKLQRTFKAEKIEQIGGHWTVSVRSMTNAQTRHRSEVALLGVKYDGNLAEDLFSERSLRSPPVLAQ